MTGPLSGVRVVELAGLGPAPFAGMLLSDMGADVIRVDRPGARERTRYDPLIRGRRSIILDLKQPGAAEVVLRLAAVSDALIEGYRPGVTERLGIGPDECCARNPALVYGRMTGWGQDGPLGLAAGHDINYISLSGVLAAIGPTGGPPVPPLNLVGDFGGGGMVLAFGVLCAILEARQSGTGQVVDASMVDGSALLMAAIYGEHARGEWGLTRGTNRLDGGAPFYGVYECADGGNLSVGAIEPQFYEAFVRTIGADPALAARRLDRSHWVADRATVATLVATKSRDEWSRIFAEVDACVAPILDMDEVATHPHNVARRTFFRREGAVEPAPAPRFSRSEPAAGESHDPGAASVDVLRDAGFAADEIDALVASGAVEAKEYTA